MQMWISIETNITLIKLFQQPLILRLENSMNNYISTYFITWFSLVAINHNKFESNLVYDSPCNMHVGDALWKSLLSLSLGVGHVMSNSHVTCTDVFSLVCGSRWCLKLTYKTDHRISVITHRRLGYILLSVGHFPSLLSWYNSERDSDKRMHAFHASIPCPRDGELIRSWFVWFFSFFF